MATKSITNLPSGIKCLEIVQGRDIWPLSKVLDMGGERAHADATFQRCTSEFSTWSAGQPVKPLILAMQLRQSSVLSIQEYLHIPDSKRIANYHPKEGAIKLDLVKVFRWKEGLRNWYDEKTMERDPFEQAEAVMVWSCYVSVETGKQLKTDAERKLLATLSLRLNRNLNDFIATCKARMPPALADNAKNASSEHQCDGSSGVASEDAIPQLSSPDMAGDSKLSEAGRLDLTHSPDSISTMDSSRFSAQQHLSVQHVVTRRGSQLIGSAFRNHLRHSDVSASAVHKDRKYHQPTRSLVWSRQLVEPPKVEEKEKLLKVERLLWPGLSTDPRSEMQTVFCSQRKLCTSCSIPS
jgi:hypothetical protein